MWVLANYEMLGRDWRAAVVQLARFNERIQTAWDVTPRLQRALEAYRLAATEDDLGSRADVAFVTLRVDNVQRGLVLVKELMKLAPERAEELRRKVLDIAEGSLVAGDFQRFAEIVAWRQLKKTQYVRPFVSQALGLLKNAVLAENVVRHLLSVGLIKQLVHEIRPEYLTRAHEFLRDLVPKLSAEKQNLASRRQLEELSDVLKTTDTLTAR